MKNLVLFSFFILMLSSCTEKSKVADCCQSSGEQFASLGNDMSFRNAHDAPLSSDYVAMGRIITFPTPDGKTGKAYYVPAKKQTKNFLFVFHEWWGLNDWIKRQADLYADSLGGVNIIALDLYDGKVGTTSEEATALMQAVDETRAQSIIKGAVMYSGEDSKIATVGWCFGGGWSLRGAMISNDHLKGCVMYYGMPETDLSKLKGLKSDVLFIWASKDQWINEKVKDDFIKNMKEAGKTLTVKEYNADHAFANPSNPHYDKEAGDDAQKIVLSYFRKSFSS